MCETSTVMPRHVFLVQTLFKILTYRRRVRLVVVSKVKIVIAGAGFAGGIVARQLIKHTNAEVIILDQCDDIKASESGTGLNVNPNGLMSLNALDAELCESLKMSGLPRTTLSAETMSGQKLYKVSLSDTESINNLALNPGLKIRWADAYTALRREIPVQYHQEVTNFDYKDGKISLQVMDKRDTSTRTINDVDFFIATDGRYSKMREIVSPATTYFIGVSNFRLLVPDTSGGLFDDMELLYNPNPVGRIGKKKMDIKDEFSFCLNSLPRIGVMRMNAVDTSQAMLWFFGNFAVDQEIPEFAKTKEGLLQLFSPSDSVVSAKAEYVLQTLSREHGRMHWARMQHTPMCFGDAANNILFLGDAAHCIVPTMGQGATLAIEDACVASKILIDDILQGKLGGNTIRRISDARVARRKFVSDVSMEDSKHLMFNSKSNDDLLEEQRLNWTSDSLEFRNRLRQVWQQAPTLSI